MGRGPPYWICDRLCFAVAEAWGTFDGEATLDSGVNLRKLDLARLLNAFEVWIRRKFAELEDGEVQWEAWRSMIVTPPGKAYSTHRLSAMTRREFQSFKAAAEDEENVG